MWYHKCWQYVAVSVAKNVNAGVYWKYWTFQLIPVSMNRNESGGMLWCGKYLRLDLNKDRDDTGGGDQLMLLIHLILLKAKEQCMTYKIAKYLLALPSLVVY